MNGPTAGLTYQFSDTEFEWHRINLFLSLFVRSSVKIFHSFPTLDLSTCALGNCLILTRNYKVQESLTGEPEKFVKANTWKMSWTTILKPLGSINLSPFDSNQTNSQLEEKNPFGEGKLGQNLIIKNPDRRTGPLARPFAGLLAPLVRLLRHDRCAHSFARSLTSLTPLLVGQWMIRWLIILCFFFYSGP